MSVTVQQRHLSVVAQVVLVLMLASATANMVSGLQFEYEAGAVNFTLQPTSGAIQPHWSNNRLWLTPDPDTPFSALSSGSVGRVVYNDPLPLLDTNYQAVSFSVFFNFCIVTADSYGHSGNGLAFAISPLLDLNATSSAGGAMGIATQYPTKAISIPSRHLFAVEFDTYQDPAFSDPSSSHIGIDINTLNSTATFDSSNSESDLYLYSNHTIFAWVQYVAPLHQILVFAANSSERPSQSCVNVTCDLSNLFDRNQSLYAAISAASGAGVQGTALFSWSFATSDNINSTQGPPSHDRSIARKLAVNFATADLIIVCVVGPVCAIWTGERKKKLKKKKRRVPLAVTENHNILSPAVTEIMNNCSKGELVPRYTYEELEKATQRFSEKQKIGAGGFSTVYKGTLSTGEVVAVKRIKEGHVIKKEFISEIQLISRVCHPNLLQLQGWAYTKVEALLVYQYMPNGSLHNYLFGQKEGDKEILDGQKRFNILVGVAAALAHLHEMRPKLMLHRDVKAENVMLTESFEAMLGDFGLVRLIAPYDEAGTSVLTPAGTHGYMAPEVLYREATDKVDVFSFGIVALEVACGRRAVDVSRQPMHILDWVWQLQESGNLIDAIDPVCWAPSVCTDVEQQQHTQGGSVANCTMDNSTGQTAEEPQLVSNKPEQADHMVMAPDCCASTSSCTVQELKWQCVLHAALRSCLPKAQNRPTMSEVLQSLQKCELLQLPSTRPPYSWSASSTVQPSSQYCSAKACPSHGIGRGYDLPPQV